MHAIFAVIPILTFQLEECRFHAPRETVLEVATATRLLVNAGAGSLRVEGKPGLRQIRIRGIACASDRALLDEIELSAQRLGNDMRVLANDRDLELRNREYARLNLIVEVPEGMAASINDGSGELELIALGTLDIIDGSGDITIRDIDGSVQIEDRAGLIRLSAVRGDVNVDDTTGEIDLADVIGTVDVRDGSGVVKLLRVGRHALISDGSGDIEIDGVGGDLTIRSDSNGGMDYRAVRGNVRVPLNRDYQRYKLWPFR
ncbi:MAG: hypothetical protein ACRENP_15310 [Longimicrobiales bacterium]